MNRRDALKGLAPVGLIAGTALSAAQPAQQHSNVSWGPQPHYHVLYMFQWHPQNFVAMGIYTKREDAETHEKAIKDALPTVQLNTGGIGGGPVQYGKRYSGCIVERSHEELCYELANHRLGAMAEHMRRFMQLPIPRDEVRMHVDGFAELYGKDQFPVAIHRKTDT